MTAQMVMFKDGIFVEVEPIKGTGGLVSDSDGIARTTAKFSEISGSIGAIIAPLGESFRSAAAKLGESVEVAEIECELSLGIKGEVGIFVAKSTADAAFKLKIKLRGKASPSKPTATR